MTTPLRRPTPQEREYATRFRLPQIEDLMLSIRNCQNAESFTLLRKRLYRGIYYGSYVLRDFDSLFLSAEKAITEIAKDKGFEYHTRNRAFR